MIFLTNLDPFLTYDELRDTLLPYYYQRVDNNQPAPNELTEMLTAARDKYGKKNIVELNVLLDDLFKKENGTIWKDYKVVGKNVIGREYISGIEHRFIINTIDIPSNQPGGSSIKRSRVNKKRRNRRKIQENTNQKSKKRKRKSKKKKRKEKKSRTKR